MTALVVRGDALSLPLRDNTVDLIVTSPPYFALRAYQTGHEMEVGSEATPQAYLEALWAATREMKRVLKPSGSIWVNLGDKYGRPGGGADVNPRSLPGAGRGATQRVRLVTDGGGQDKCLMGLPWRYAIGCIDQLGLILRRDLIWDKANPLPESAGDRMHSSHEYWFHLVKSPRYYSAIDELREPWTGKTDSAPRSNGAATAGHGAVAFPDELATGSSGETARPSARTALPTNCSWDPSQQACKSTTCAATACASGPTISSSLPCVRTCSAATRMPPPMQLRLIVQPDTPTTSGTPTGHLMAAACARNACERRTADGTGDSSKLGKWPGSVWRIPSQPLKLPTWVKEQHYAAFGPEWPRRLILGFTPHLICGVCKVGRFPVIDKRYETDHFATQDARAAAGTHRHHQGERPYGIARTEATIVGYACGCTPFTDHPGTGEPSGPTYAASIATDGYPRAPENLNGRGETSLQNRPKVGPWREYHLDRWTPPPGRPAVVLDPFGGTGTVAHVARALDPPRHAISIDLSEAYCRVATDATLARWRAGKVAGRVNRERQGSLL